MKQLECPHREPPAVRLGARTWIALAIALAGTLIMWGDFTAAMWVAFQNGPPALRWLIVLATFGVPMAAVIMAGSVVYILRPGDSRCPACRTASSTSMEHE